VFHVELRQFPHQTRAFNLTREELDARIVGPWIAGEAIEMDDYRWLPDRATLTIYEGPLLGLGDMGLGRGWQNVTRKGREVTQEVLLDVWRSASRFDAGLGSAAAWVMTLAHRRAVDRVRSEQKAAEREMRVASSAVAYDEVAEAVEARLDRERVRRCLGSLTELQRESVTLAYYGGYTYREVAGLLGVAIGTVKTRMRDGLIRLRDCLGVDP